MSDRVQLEASWKARVGDYLQRDEMQRLSAFLRERKAVGARIFPSIPWTRGTSRRIHA